MSKLAVGPDEELWKGRFISVLRRPFTNVASGASGQWELVKRKTRGRIVGIMAITPEKEVVLVKIFRIPLMKYVIECAAGLPDHSDESAEELAARELLEETGYRCAEITEVVSGTLNSGLTDDVMALFLGTGAKKVAEPKLEDAEDIEVLTVPLADLERYLHNPPDGMLVDLKLWALVPFLRKL